MRRSAALATFSFVAGVVATIALVACGSDAGSIEDPGNETGTNGEGGTDPDGAIPPDGSTVDVILFDAGAPCDGAACDRRIAFVTQNAYDGDFGNLGGADQVCMTEAMANPLLAGRSFRAWLSTNGTSARTRFPAFTGTLRRVDGEIIAVGMNELITTGPRVPINRPPSSTTAISTLVWTGTSADGNALQNRNCSGWGSGGTTEGSVGKSDDLPNWTSSAPDRPCGVPLMRLYCIEN